MQTSFHFLYVGLLSEDCDGISRPDRDPRRRPGRAPYSALWVTVREAIRAHGRDIPDRVTVSTAQVGLRKTL